MSCVLGFERRESMNSKVRDLNAAAKLVILSKTDLLPHLRFDMQQAMQNALAVNPDVEVIALSAYSGGGLDRWYDWLKSSLAASVGAAA
jgi:hydrogenase nickel incorporation protein HypB